jgi:hypothetical protein
MLKRFSFLFALVFALSTAGAWAQTFTYNMGTTWQSAGTWTPAMGATGFPGQAANNGDVTISPTTSAVNFTDAPPAFPISSLTMGGTQPVAVGAGTLTITGAFTLNAGATLNIPANATVVVNGASTIGGTINLLNATSKIIFNGAVTQSGAGVITAVANSTVQLGAGVTSIAGVLFGPAFGGTIQTGGALALTSNLTMGANGVLNLVGTMTVNSGITLTIQNTNAGAITGAGNLQGAAANAIVDLTAGPTALQGTWFANPFNGTLRTNSVAASSLMGTLTIGSTGILDLGQQLNPAAGANLILNNTAANSLTGTGAINVIAGVTVTLGPGFNGGTLNGDRFISPILGTLNTGGNLTATGTSTPILEFGNNSVFNITGTLTIAAGKTIYINNITAGALPGSGTFAATNNTSVLRFVAGANGGSVSGAVFSNPWNGRLQTDGLLQIGEMPGTVGASVFTAGPNAIFDLGGDLQINDSLALNCTQSESVVFPNPGFFITALTGGPSTGSPGPGGRVTVGASAFAGFLPVTRLGTGASWADGNLFIAGSSALNANYTLNNGAYLFLNPGSVLQVASTRILTLNGRILGTGRINGQDNTAQVVLGATFTNPANNGNIPGANLGNPNFDGLLTISQPRVLSGSLRIGANAIYDNLGNQTTVNAPDTLFLNPTAAGGLTGTGAFVGNGTISLGNNALGATFPATNIVSGGGNFTGRIITGDNVNFALNYALNNPTILQVNGNSQINAGVTLTINNTAANSLTGTGTLQAQTANSIVDFAAGANGGTVPGARFASPYIGQITTAGAMNLTGNLNMGASSKMTLGGNLTLSPSSQVTLGMSGTPAATLLGTGLFVGQPGGGNTPEIVLPNGALSGQLPTAKISTGPGAGQFGGRLTVGTGYAVTTNLAINQPAILNVQTGAQLLVNAGQTLTLNTTNSPAIGPGAGRIQGQDNTAIVSLANGFNGGVLPGNVFATPFSGQLIVPSMGLNQSDTLTMGVMSILLLSGNLNLNANASLTLNGGVNSVQGTGLLNGSGCQARITLGANFNGGTIPAGRFAVPFNGGLATTGPMTFSGTMNFAANSCLIIGGNTTVPAGVNIGLNMSGANSLSGAGTFVAGSATSVVALGPGFNNSVIPGNNFNNFGGVVTMATPLALGAPLTLGATGALDLGGGGNTLTLGAHNLSVAQPVRSTSSTAFIVTNGAGAFTFNNPAVASVFFPIGTSSSNYTPIVVSNAGPADVFTVRARPGLTNSATTYPNFVNTEWVITQGGAGNRNVTFAPRWNTANQQGAGFNVNAVGLGLFINNAYVETATGASVAVGNQRTFSGNFNAAFNGTTLVAFSRVVLPPPVIVQPIITSVMPNTVPVSNEDFTINFVGTNLENIRTVTARNQTSETTVNGTIVGNQSASSLSVSFPGIVRGIAGTLAITMTNATIPGFAVATVTVTPISSPTLTAASPATTATGRAFTLNLTGTGFLSQSRFTINGNAARVMKATTATSVAIEIPASVNSTSNTLTLRVTNTDNQTASLSYTIGEAPRPNITNISPRAVFVGENGVTITVEGSGFFGQGFVTAIFGSTQIPVTVESANRLTLTVPANLLTSVGFPSILIRNSDGQSIGYVFSILERVPLGPRPELTSFTPTTTTASSRSYSVELNGVNFSPNALVTVRGTVVTPKVIQPNRVVVEVVAGLNINPGQIDIVIQNPDLQFVRATVMVGAALPAPVLNSVMPLTTLASVHPGREFTLTLRGSNFTPNAIVLFNGQPLQIVAQGADSIRVIIPTNSLRQPSILREVNTIVVLNGDGQATAPATYVVNPNSVLDNALSGMSVYPSPVSDMMTIQGRLERPASLLITVTNVVGQRVMSFVETQVSGVYSRQFNVANLAPGAYIVEINDGARRMTQKIMKY